MMLLMAWELFICFGIFSAPSVRCCFRAGCEEKACRPGFLGCVIKGCYCASWGKCTKQCLGWLNECLSSRSVCVHVICFLSWAVCSCLCVPLGLQRKIQWCGTCRASSAMEILGFTVICAELVFPDAQHPELEPYCSSSGEFLWCSLS